MGFVLMKMIPFLFSLALTVGLTHPAIAAKKKTHHSTQPADNSTGTGDETDSPADHGSTAKPADAEHASSQKPLDFDFFGGQGGAATDGRADLVTPPSELADEARTRRWMLTTHQILGVSTWVSLAALVTVGQLNYNQLYGSGGGGSDANKWQPYHRALVISTSTLFAATATFAILAPTPYKRPLRFDTGLVHRIAVIGATLGMITEGFLGWWTTHQADAGNPHNLRTMARTHQIVGYTTLGFLTVAGTVWLF
jgi:hypothetical protein